MTLGWTPNQDTWNLSRLGSVFLAAEDSLAHVALSSTSKEYPCLGMSTRVLSPCDPSDTALPRVLKQTDTLNCHSSTRTGQVPQKEPQSFKQEDKATAPVHQLCPGKHLCAYLELCASSLQQSSTGQRGEN